jgi:hypothetical protein
LLEDLAEILVVIEAYTGTLSESPTDSGIDESGPIPASESQSDSDTDQSFVPSAESVSVSGPPSVPTVPTVPTDPIDPT